MTAAAVPEYLGTVFKDASPGLRFGLLLPIWTNRQDQEQEVHERANARSREGQEVSALLRQRGMETAIRELQQRERKPLPGLWQKNDYAAREAWKSVAQLTDKDKLSLEALAARQQALADTLPEQGLLRLQALSTAPFTTGLGNEHPLENGFAFLNPYGLPYLPGSGVKGVLRQAARELASGEWGTSAWLDDRKAYTLERPRRDPIQMSLIDVLFGRETDDSDTDQVRGALSFWDVIPQIPQIPGNSLLVEVMTPHQSHYYQGKAQAGSPEPHDSGRPNPIHFLTVPPGSGFAFHAVCDLAHLARLTEHRAPHAPDLLTEGPTHWKTLLAAAFTHAFQWLGFGAKTSVGYGAMRRNEEEEARAHQARVAAAQAAEQQRKDAERAAQRASLTPAQRACADFVEFMQQRVAALNGKKTKVNEADYAKAQQLAKHAREAADWAADERRSVADAIEQWTPKVVAIEAKDLRKKLDLRALRGEA